MATRRTTSGKRQREREKQARAAEKRARRQAQASENALRAAIAVDEEDLTTDELLARMQALHAEYEAGTLSFEDFDERKAELTDRIALRLAE
jgi:hypothetical protein